MASLGNVDTGGFSKESIAAMQDSDYFKPKRGFEGFRHCLLYTSDAADEV